VICTRCRGTRWVCERHPDRPWDGEHRCGCGPLPSVQRQLSRMSRLILKRAPIGPNQEDYDVLADGAVVAVLRRQARP
jgi:hypothetical protein